MKTTPRVILILKQASPTTRRAKLWPRRRPRHGDRSSRGSNLLLPQYIFRKAEKNQSTSQPQVQNEDTPATIEADHILLTLQQLANIIKSANFHNNINRFSKLPKSLTTTMPTFEVKTEKFELFEDLFQASLKFQNQLTEDYRINYLHSLKRGDPLQNLKNTIMAQPQRIWETSWQLSEGNT